MKFSIRRIIATFAVSFAAALLVLASTLSAQAQANSVVVPSANSESETQGAPSGGETGKPAVAATGKPAAHKAAHPKKKKSSFMHEMRDKAVQQVQKLLGSKQQPKQQ
ncbi:MAG TPA: hypothetical protein VJX23_11850 [Candidatus Binataceae bacterium]|nr:hypothetical protein [Candidatus Binataceae bacterium]